MKLPFFKFYTADYAEGVSHFSILEEGAYMRLLRTCWSTPGCSIPADEDWIFKRLVTRTDEEKEAVRSVLHEKFKRNKSNRYYNQRLKKEWKESSLAYKNKCDAQKRRYSKTNKKVDSNRSDKPLKTSKNNHQTDQQSEPKPELEPIYENKDKSLSSLEDKEDLFSKFWREYPGTEGQNRNVTSAEWQKLTLAESREALNSLSAYKDKLKDNPKMPSWQPTVYIRDKIFSTFGTTEKSTLIVVRTQYSSVPRYSDRGRKKTM